MKKYSIDLSCSWTTEGMICEVLAESKKDAITAALRQFYAKREDVDVTSVRVGEWDAELSQEECLSRYDDSEAQYEILKVQNFS